MVVTLKEGIQGRGAFAVWNLLTEEEHRQAATALWNNADAESRAALEMTLAKELKFRPQSVRRLSAERVVGRIVRLVSTLPEKVLFQFLFHLHMADRRELLTEFLDAVGLPHKEGVLELPDDAEAPDGAKVEAAAIALVASHDRQALVYLATLKIADSDFWTGVDDVLASFTEDGDPVTSDDEAADPETSDDEAADPETEDDEAAE